MTNIYIQSCATRQFLKDDDSWTSRPEEAHSFTHSLGAIHHCFEKGFRDVLLVMKFNHPDVRDVTVPLKFDDKDQVVSNLTEDT